MDYPGNFNIALQNSVYQPMIPDYQHPDVFPVGIWEYPAQIWEFSQAVGHLNETFGKVFCRWNRFTSQVANYLFEIVQAVGRPSYFSHCRMRFLASS